LKPLVRHFYHEPTGTLSYVVSDPQSRAAAIIDPVLDFSIITGGTNTGPAQAIIDYVRNDSLSVEWILETHAHADHLSSAQYLKRELGAPIAIGRGIRVVQSHFAGVFNLKPPFMTDGSQFDRLFDEDDTFRIGGLECRVINTPGHTSDSITYLIGDAAFVGDSLFMPDYGTARCDFPGGDAGLLYDSIQALFALPDDTRLFMCHDYPPDGRPPRFEVPLAEQKADNIHVKQGTSKVEFVAMREQRDATLSLPKLLLPAIQVNIRAGHLPDTEDNNVAYLKIPLDQF
jgi:glyoxylase-like metal-dependent hydrolase (beta-lactamase superfamily II)